MNCSDEMTKFLLFDVFSPDKRLLEVKADLREMDAEEWKDLNKNLVEPLGRNDIAVELDALLEKYGDNITVGDFVTLDPNS